ESLVSDAEIIPIGTEGRPGRGSGRARPSSAARDLAPPGRRARATTGADGPARPAQEGRDAAGGSRAPTTTEERHPLAGIPVGDWLAAFQSAAKELFDEEWERRLAELLAFWRRRINGDYAVDEYGFDPEITQRF